MKYVPKPLTRAVGHTMLKTSQHSPQLLFGAGIIGFGATVVLAARATLKVEDLLDDHHKKLIDVNTIQHERYSESDRKHDQTVLYAQTTFKLVKLYGPAIVTGTLSVAALTGSHHILSKRNAALTAAYAAVEKAFGQYRDRVRHELGDKKDREFRYGTREIQQTAEGKNGPETKTMKVFDVNDPGMYAKVFDRLNENFQPQPELNRIFLDSVQNYMNDRLHARGHLFLNEVYRALGYDHTKAGAIVGWKMGNGDNFIDFGEMRNAAYDSQQYINGGAILLDFNVDGPIYNLLDN